MEFKSIRRSQTLSPFGVGAIMDIEGESLVAADINYWKGAGEEIHEPRLEKYLSVTRFKMAQPAPEYQREITLGTPGVPFVRFPTWQFCSRCRRMYRNYSRTDAPVCPKCQPEIKLTPMRFVMACPRGHLTDVPWDRWAHSRSKSGRCEEPELYFKTEPGGSGLEFVYVECTKCKSRRNLYGIASKDSLRQLNVRCTGHHPWTPWEERDRNCDAVPQVLQRGATNLTFAAIASSIDIPPFSSWGEFSQNTLQITNDPLFSAIRSAHEEGDDDFIRLGIIRLSKRYELKTDAVRRIVYRELEGDDTDTDVQMDADELLFQEYRALAEPAVQYDPRDRFIKNDVPIDDYPEDDSNDIYRDVMTSLKEKIGGVSQVTRLREVRALRGFSRLGPAEADFSADEDEPGRFSLYDSHKKISPQLVAADLDGLPRTDRWLPAIEVFGEGIFLRLNEEAVQQWESHPDIRKRASVLAQRREENAPYLPIPSPRLILLHTLSHILIRQLSFECGYSIASLRERVYARTPESGQEPAAGILIYTAAGDSEGTLGGLVREGKAKRLLPTLLHALQEAEWCSSDPLCRESQGQGLFAMNLAACHACSLLPETSCTMSNRLLDRIMLLGNLDESIPGYFSEAIRKIITSQVL